MTIEDAAYKNAEIHRTQADWSRDMANKAIAEYTRFLGVLSGIILGLSPLLINNSNGILTTLGVKILITVSLVLIILSIPFGAISMLLESRFFVKMMNNEQDIFTKWQMPIGNPAKFDEADAFQRGIYKNTPSSSPFWPMIVQSIMVILGLFGILAVVIIKIFQ